MIKAAWKDFSRQIGIVTNKNHILCSTIKKKIKDKQGGIRISTKALLGKETEKVFVMANEAMVRGALEADVKVISAYPGAPTSEILDTFNKLQDSFDYKFTLATNEKVALETAAGGSMAGFRSLTSMKSVGLNVASDAFYSLAYTGINGGMVLVVADDPHCHSSQSEQDARFFGPSAYVPIIEPSHPAEAREMIKSAFEISEKHKTMVLIRTTTRVNHQSGIIELGPYERKEWTKNKWSEMGQPFFTVGEVAKQNKHILLKKIADLKEDFEASPYNQVIPGNGDVGIITSGACFLYTKDATRALNIEPHILKLGTTYPLPDELITEFIKGLNIVIIVEELSPYLEHNIKRIAKDVGSNVTVIGKDSGHFSEAEEYNVPIVINGLAKVLSLPPPRDYDAVLERAKELKSILPPRVPVFCAGCPHRASFWAIKQAIRGRHVVFNGDIGCYSMAFFPPLSFMDSMLSMGSSLGVSAGMAQVLEDDVMCMVGDSTFFHAALPGLVNAVYHDLNITLFVLDNEVTAMTGQQTHPGTPEGRGMPDKKSRIMIEDVCKGIGVKHLTILDPYDPKANIQPIKEAFDFTGPSVVLMRRSCALHGDRIKRRTGVQIIPNEVDKDSCQKPHTCIRDFHCPAIKFDTDDRASHIQTDTCDGCSVCAKICPFGVIHPVGSKGEGKEVGQ